MIGRISVTRALFASALAAAALSGHAAAHGDGVIRVADATVAAGDAIAVEGEEMPASSRVAIQLQGALEGYDLGEVDTDAGGAFEAELPLPVDVKPGSYAVVVVASDGDPLAEAPVVVEAPVPDTIDSADTVQPEPTVADATAQPEARPEAVTSVERADAPETAVLKPTAPSATAEMMNLPTGDGAGGRLVILALIVLAMGSGALLLRRS